MTNYINANKRSRQIIEYGTIGFMFFVFGFPVAVATFLCMTFVILVINNKNN